MLFKPHPVPTKKMDSLCCLKKIFKTFQNLHYALLSILKTFLWKQGSTNVRYIIIHDCDWTRLKSNDYDLVEILNDFEDKRANDLSTFVDQVKRKLSSEIEERMSSSRCWRVRDLYLNLSREEYSATFGLLPISKLIKQ